MPRREVVVVSDRVYEWFERLAKKYGLSANDLMSKYLEMFGYLARYLEDDVELLRQNFREVPTSTLLQLALYRLLLSSGNIHEALKYALEHLELYERGYVLQGVLAAIEETGEITGVIFTFAASGISGSLVDTVTLHIGIHVRLGGKSEYFPTGGVLTASVFIGDKEELGEKFEDTLTRLRSALYDSEVITEITRLEREICEKSGVCNVKVTVEHDREIIELLIEVLSGNYTKLPSIKRIEELARLITSKAGVNLGNQRRKAPLNSAYRPV